MTAGKLEIEVVVESGLGDEVPTGVGKLVVIVEMPDVGELGGIEVGCEGCCDVGVGGFRENGCFGCGKDTVARGVVARGGGALKGGKEVKGFEKCVVGCEEGC